MFWMCALLAALLSFIAPVTGAAPALRAAVGTNLDGIAAHSPQVPFSDVMRSSTPWISGDKDQWSNSQPLDLDARGWVRSLRPGQWARTLMVREIGTHYPAGRYRVRYDGEGKINFAFAARVVSSRAGEMDIDVKPDPGGIQLVLESTNPANPVRNISVTLPGGICEADPFQHVASAAGCGGRRGAYLAFASRDGRARFNPAFLAQLRPYSVLRFMDWMQANNSPVAQWDDRARLDDATWATERGVPPEVMIELANVLVAHPWFTLPHRSDDRYAQSLARLAVEKLRAELSVYTEHSNEIWNPQFRQYRHALERAKATGRGIDNFQYHAERSADIGASFAAALGPSRVVAVLGAQAGNPWTATQALEHLRKRSAGRPLPVSALAIAPYFGVSPNPSEAALYAGMEPRDLIALTRARLLPQVAETVQKYRRIADQYGVALVAYEGGQHMVGIQGAEGHEALNRTFDAFNRDPRMRELYLEYLDAWKQSGGELFVHFGDISRYGRWGRWGALEYLGQPREAAPKYDALLRFMERNPPWWRTAAGAAGR